MLVAITICAPLAACSETTSPHPTAVKVVHSCSLISAAQVAEALGTPVTQVTNETSSCSWSSTSQNAIGNVDPSESPPPNTAVLGAAITILSGSAAANARSLSHPPVFSATSVTIPGSDAAYLLSGPHIGIILAQRGATAIRIDVLRGKTEDPYLEKRLAATVVEHLPS
jgi:hypothetical protein